jgi:hypothetical protein
MGRSGADTDPDLVRKRGQQLGEPRLAHRAAQVGGVVAVHQRTSVAPTHGTQRFGPMLGRAGEVLPPRLGGDRTTCRPRAAHRMPPSLRRRDDQGMRLLDGDSEHLNEGRRDARIRDAPGGEHELTVRPSLGEFQRSACGADPWIARSGLPRPPTQYGTQVPGGPVTVTA